ncbi:MAG: GNAT family N-acetyltransferase [Micrococcales bacterium]|nr:GNAT family N-acetyltransferase [Micrococcales bacterium]
MGVHNPAVVVEPATEARFDDLAAVLGPKNPQATVCWCLSHRLPAAENRSLTGPARGDRVRELTRQDVAPGVLAYVDGQVAGWAATAPRRQLPYSRSRKIPQVDDLDVWVVWCVRVQPGHRRQGLAVTLVRGAADYAFSQGAPAVEGYPVDNGTERVDLTMAYVGTRTIFERAGFHKAMDTQSVSGGFPRVLMRRDPG